MISRPHIYYLLAFLLAILSGCHSYVRVSSENLASSYTAEYKSVCEPPVLVHLNDSITLLQVTPIAENLLFARKKTSEPFEAQLEIRALVFEKYESTQPYDSSSMMIRIAKDSALSLNETYTMPLSIKTGQAPVVYQALTDIHKDSRQTIVLDAVKTNAYDAFWFEPDARVLRSPSGYFCHPGDTISFASNAAQAENMVCWFYSDSFSIPVPPFQFENATPMKLEKDSVLPVLYQSATKKFSTVATSPGLYFFSSSADMQSGFTVICTEDGFPEIVSHQAMLGPIQYISTQKEYKKIAEAENLVSAIEDFWLKIGGQEEHSRNLIRSFYSRVMITNQLFTSHTEGWKTDRGMIYIVFGPPNIVYRDGNNESWVYGEENNFFSISFVFQKMENRFSNNDYYLQRTPVYKDNWYRAVDIWRQ